MRSTRDTGTLDRYHTVWFCLFAFASSFLFHFTCIFEGYRFVAKCLSRADLAMFFSYDCGWSTLVFVLGAFFSFWKFNRFLCVPFRHRVCCFRFVYLCETAKSVKSLGLKDNATNQIRMKIY